MFLDRGRRLECLEGTNVIQQHIEASLLQLCESELEVCRGLSADELTIHLQHDRVDVRLSFLRTLQIGANK